MDEQRALAGLKIILSTKAARQRALDLARNLLALSGPISEEKEQRLQHVAQLLGITENAPVKKRAAPVRRVTAAPKAAAKKTATKKPLAQSVKKFR
jgi:DNA repair protein RadC